MDRARAVPLTQVEQACWAWLGIRPFSVLVGGFARQARGASLGQMQVAETWKQNSVQSNGCRLQLPTPQRS